MKGERIERCIRLLPNGAYEVRVHVRRDPRTRKLRQVSRTVHGGIRAARAMRSRLENEAKQGKHGGENATIGYLLDQWNDHREQMGRARTTLHEDRRKVDTVIRPALGDKTLSKLSVRDIDAFYGAQLAKGTNPNTLLKYHAILRGALNQAMRWGWTHHNVTKLATLPVYVSPTDPVPLPDEVRRCIAAAASPKARNKEMAGLVTVAALSGMREGELCGLQFRDVDWDEHTVTVRRSVWQIGGEIGVKETKSHQVRTLIVDDLGMVVLDHRRRLVAEAAEVLGRPFPAEAFVWSRDPLGAVPWRPKTVSANFARVRNRAGVKSRLHDLRHFAGTEMIAAGVNPRTVADRLGHADPSITLRVYTAGRAERDREAAAILGRALRPR